MTAVRYIYNLLDTTWESDASKVTGRTFDVPKPAIYMEAEGGSRHNLRDSDMITVRDAGPVDFSPQGLGWTEERIEAHTTIDIRTVHSRERIFGHRDENNVSETYGGLQGEVKRIMDTVRKGDQEWDLVVASPFNDLTSDMGYQMWRGTFDVRLITVASNVNP